MKKDAICLSVAFFSAICGIGGAVLYAGQPIGLIVGIGFAVLGAIFGGVGLGGIFASLSKQQEDRRAADTKRLEVIQNSFAALQKSVETQKTPILESQQKAQTDLMEYLRDQSTALSAMILEIHQDDQRSRKAIADENRKQDLEFQEEAIEELAAINSLLKTGKDLLPDCKNVLEDISTTVAALKTKQSEMTNKLQKVIEEGDEELVGAFKNLQQAIANHLTSYRDILQKYSDVTEQDAQIIKNLLGDQNE